MSLLAILLPSRPRPASVGDAVAAPRSLVGTEWRYAFSRDGLKVDQEGCAAAANLPKAERVVLVAPDDEVAWMPVQLPKAAASRLREVLGGALEDQLLDDAATTHLALSKAGLHDGQTSWVAALHKPWLDQCLSGLRDCGFEADSLVALSEPDSVVRGHAQLSTDGQTWAVVAGPHGVASWPWLWSGWKSRLTEEVSWTAEPAAAAALADLGLKAQRLVNASERMLAAAATGSNLLQFDLAPRMKGSRVILAAWAQFKSPRYRAIHVGLAALLLIQIIGLNVSAWRAERELQALRAQADRVLQQTFPSVKVVVDPRVQMEREIQLLRQTSGQPGPTDLETWIDLTSGLRGGQAKPLLKVQLSTQGLAMEADEWPQDVVSALQEHARQQGWQVRLEGQSLRLTGPTAGR